jgi:tRNA modification GTPase
MSTIFALSSGAGRAGVAVIRISGPAAGAAARDLTRGELPEPRRAALVALHDPESGALLDKVLVLWFPAPHSFTGEDVAELHVHGGPAVIAAVLAALGQLGLEPAAPGEFTRRAFEHGKLDLTEVEGLADLISAETEAQRRQAVRQMDGALGELYEGWRARLTRALAHLEADIDFPDEDMPGGVAEAVRPDLSRLRGEIAVHLARGPEGQRLREGLRVALVGPPNAGKSTLVNALARRDVAIVSETAGTTRDIIEVHLDIGGWPVTVADMAGMRDAAEDIEAEGVRRARQRAKNADLRIGLLAADGGDDAPAILDLLGPEDVLAVNKIDLDPHWRQSRLVEDLPEVWRKGLIGISARSGEGLPRLEESLCARFGAAKAPAESPVWTRERHRLALEQALAALDRALAADPAMPELGAEDVRLALRALGRITGRVDVEDILDMVFRDFCIGK